MAHYTKTLLKTVTQDDVDSFEYEIKTYSEAEHINETGSFVLSALSETDIDAVVEDFNSPYQEPVLDYAAKRSMEYPEISEQLDKIFHDGLDAWKAEIQAIKDKHPKS